MVKPTTINTGSFAKLPQSLKEAQKKISDCKKILRKTEDPREKRKLRNQIEVYAHVKDKFLTQEMLYKRSNAISESSNIEDYEETNSEEVAILFLINSRILKCKKLLRRTLSPHKRRKLRYQIEAYIDAMDECLSRQTFHKHPNAISESSPMEKDEELENMQLRDKIVKSGDVVNVPFLSGTFTHFSLADFFKRPVKIFEANPGPDIGTREIDAIEPYALWSIEDSVRAKLKTYSYFRGNLKVRMVINASRFQNGSLALSWYPLDRYQDVYTAYSNINTPEDFIPAFINYQSQSPEFRHIYFPENYIVETTLPFVCPRPAVRLYNQEVDTIIGDDTDYLEMKRLGTLQLWLVNQVRNFNTSTEGINIQLYAWCDDIELGAPTATNIAISESSTMEELEKVPDEYAEPGPVTKVASAISKVSGSLSNVPVIGGIASATSKVSGTIAKVSDLFGFSKPVTIDPTSNYKPQVAENMAFTSGKDTSVKLTADPKQGLGIVDLGAENGKDSMAISYIAARRSLYTTFEWNIDDTPFDTILHSVLMNPLLTNKTVINTAGGDVTHAQPTALAFAAYPFAHWRGTLSYHFKVASSNFHRGKLMIVYEPNLSDFGNISAATVTLNQQYFYIMDLEYDKEIIIDVGFVHNRYFARTRGNTTMVDLPNFFSNGAINTDANTRSNLATGGLFIKPFVSLKGGDSVSSQTVEVNASIFSDDLEVAYPIDVKGTSMDSVIHSESSPMEYITTTHVASGVVADTKRVRINKFQHDCNDDAYLYHFGEKILSYRALLKRYFTSMIVRYPETSVHLNARLQELDIKTMYPVLSGRQIPQFNGQAIAGSVALDEANNDSIHTVNMFNYLRHAYVGMRGGMRSKVQYYTHQNFIPNLNVTIAKSPPKDSAARGIAFENQALGSGSFTMHIGSSLSGSHSFDGQVNPVVEYENPFFSGGFFTTTSGRIRSDDDMFTSLFEHTESGVKITTNIGNITADFFTVHSSAIAEDFSFVRFQGAPFFSGREGGQSSNEVTYNLNNF